MSQLQFTIFSLKIFLSNMSIIITGCNKIHLLCSWACCDGKSADLQIRLLYVQFPSWDPTDIWESVKILTVCWEIPLTKWHPRYESSKGYWWMKNGRIAHTRFSNKCRLGNGDGHIWSECHKTNYWLISLNRAVHRNIDSRTLLCSVRAATTLDQYSPVRPSRIVINKLLHFGI